MVFNRGVSRGFTLAETAIAMVIVGVLIGGVVKGTQMIQDGRMKASVVQLGMVKTAVEQFHTAFKGLPGDIADGDTRIAGCGAACKNTGPNAGDGKIGSPTWDMTAFQSASIADAASATDAGETVVFWRELAQSNLLPGVTAAGVMGAAAAFGKSLPASSLGGGVLVGYSDGAQAGAAQGRPAGAGNYSMVGTVLALAATPADLTTTSGAQALTPALAAQIDKKMDDGLPNSGAVQAFGTTASCYGAAAPYAYAEATGKKDCGLYYLISEPDAVNAACGTAHETRVTAAPSSNLCTNGDTPAVAGSSLFSWTCAGTYSGVDARCLAYNKAGTIDALTGTVSIVQKNGTTTPAALNDPVWSGDTVVTAPASSANIKFNDNSIFALDADARMMIDKYNYDSASTTDRSFFSILKGAFIYTSGLIGSGNPANVNIETPVGSIGIRGTVVGGLIQPPPATSTIVIFEGAVAVTNGAGTRDLTAVSGFDTIQLSSYQGTPSGGTATADPVVTNATPDVMTSAEFNTMFPKIPATTGQTFEKLVEDTNHPPGDPPPPATTVMTVAAALPLTAAVTLGAPTPIPDVGMKFPSYPLFTIPTGTIFPVGGNLVVGATVPPYTVVLGGATLPAGTVLPMGTSFMVATSLTIRTNINP